VTCAVSRRHGLEGSSPKAKEGVSGHGVPQSTPSRYNDMRRLNNAVIARQRVGGWHGQQENGAQAADDSLVQLKLSAAIYYRARPILGVGVARWGKKLKETPALTAVDFQVPIVPTS
jgi:hypothetical protein